MKFLIYGLIVLAATVYVVESQNFAETLLRRAEAIVERAKEELHRLHSVGRGHLVAELEHEINVVEEIARGLRMIPSDAVMELHHIHEVEERLLKHENRLIEELIRIEAHDGSHQRHELEAKAVELLRRAKHDLERLHNAGETHLVQEIEHEVYRIEELLHELRAYPSAHLDFEHGHQILQRLAEHERRLAEE